jgi:hypothetical protein
MKLLIIPLFAISIQSLSWIQVSIAESIDLQFNQTKDSLIILEKHLAYKTEFDTSTRLLNLKLFSKSKYDWQKLQEFDALPSPFGVYKVETMDFNQDGLNDLRMYFTSGGRGANSYYYVFIRDGETHKFNRIKQAEGIPNIHFDSTTNMISSFAFTASTYFSFYNYRNDSFIIQKQIEVWGKNEWTFRKYDFYNAWGRLSSTKLDSVYDHYNSIFSPEL